jgi:helix-turn-helix protein
MTKKLYKISEVAEMYNKTRVAVYRPIIIGRLKAVKVSKEWFVDLDDYKEYLAKRWSRQFSKIDGKPRFDASIGECSIQDAAKALGVDCNKVYDLCRTSKIPFFKRKGSYVLKIDDVRKVKQNDGYIKGMFR